MSILFFLTTFAHTFHAAQALKFGRASTFHGPMGFGIYSSLDCFWSLIDLGHCERSFSVYFFIAYAKYKVLNIVYFFSHF